MPAPEPEDDAPQPQTDPFEGVPQQLRDALERRGFSSLTAVQQAVVEGASTERDLRIHGVRDIHRIPYGVHTRALPELPPKTAAPPVRPERNKREARSKETGELLTELLENTPVACEKVPNT